MAWTLTRGACSVNHKRLGTWETWARPALFSSLPMQVDPWHPLSSSSHQQLGLNHPKRQIQDMPTCDDEVGEDEVELEGLAKEAESREKSDLGEGDEPEEEEVVSHDERAIDLIKSSITTSQLITTRREYGIPLDVTLKRKENKEEPIVDALRMTFSLRVKGGNGNSKDWLHLMPRNFFTAVWPDSRLSQPPILFAKSNKILRLKVQHRMKKFVLSPQHLTAYGLWANHEAKEEGTILPRDP
ncbi:hypothetical protein FNV43_RR00649 [Rhamnella rubrinervis]|uniref:Uncharacterized protein n=1 Tax=Rhamnella rubrinervis TaxID=2594499 RepID=A0A8K0MRD0_9ROSA|nr:hypothetical protein FNV43_RR00649 [Rhamnella rubrinervis]